MTQPTKKKKGQFSRLSSLRFALLWTLTTGIAWASMTGVSLLIDNIWWNFFSLLPEWIYVVVGGMLVGVIAGAGQQWLLRRRFGSRVRGWLRTTIAAWGIGTFSFYVLILEINLVNSITSPAIVQFVLTFYTLFVPMTLVQLLFLHKHVKRAWLWVAGTIASSATFSLFFYKDSSSGFLSIINGPRPVGMFRNSVRNFTMLDLNLFEAVQYLPDRMQFIMAFCILFISMMIIQSFVFWKHVKRVFLWIAASIAVSMAYSLPFRNDNIYNDLDFLADAIASFGLAGLLQGSVMGVVMLWLWQMGTKPQDALRESESDDTAQAVSRLAEPDSIADKQPYHTAHRQPASQRTGA